LKERKINNISYKLNKNGMKKLLSICFLSILLGLLSFSAQAQNCGFLIKNLQPDTIEGVVQMSPDGLLPLDHTLGSGVFINSDDPYDFYGNANVGRTELYELFLCNTCVWPPKPRFRSTGFFNGRTTPANG